MMIFFKWLVIYVLTLEARLVLWRFKPRIVAITGSVGKTTTKDAIYAALSRTHAVRRSSKSLNSEIGVPLTILGLASAWNDPLSWLRNIIKGLSVVIGMVRYPKWLVLEIGADRPGDIRTLASWLKPEIAVITGVPEMPVHVEFFSSPEALMREKRSLAEYVPPHGRLVLNGDDLGMIEMCKEFEGMTLRYGFQRENHFSATHRGIVYEKGRPVGVRFRLLHEGASQTVAIHGALGKSQTYAALAAFTVAEIAGVDVASAAGALADWTPPQGRMRILQGVNRSTIIDDTYNSSPAAALAALDTLKEVIATRRMAVLGDMLELGKLATEAHRNVGARAATCADMLITVGFRSRATGEAALDTGMSESAIREYEQFESARAGEELKSELREGDVVLIKGSQAMRMERAVKEIMAEPARAKEFLVRQEPEWLRR